MSQDAEFELLPFDPMPGPQPGEQAEAGRTSGRHAGRRRVSVPAFKSPAYARALLRAPGAIWTPDMAAATCVCPAVDLADSSADVVSTELFEFETLDLETPAQPVLRMGSSGSAVRDLQQRLLQAGYNPGPIDGIFGSQTDRAVRAYQQARGLSIDGIVGPQTWAALSGGKSSTPSPGSWSPQPISGGSLRSRIAQVAMQEWQRWGNGSINESDPRMRSTLEDYWRVATRSVPGTASWWSAIPWSAVFISWVMAKAGAGSNFSYGSAHTTYVAAAKRNRLAGNSNPFKTYRIDEVAPQVGDLVCQERENSGVSYDNVDDGNFRASHSDIVVEALPGKLTVIGGNVSNTVGRKTISTSQSSGRLNGRPYYAVLKVEG